jgi:hypothetical protein
LSLPPRAGMFRVLGPRVACGSRLIETVELARSMCAGDRIAVDIGLTPAQANAMSPAMRAESMCGRGGIALPWPWGWRRQATAMSPAMRARSIVATDATRARRPLA